MLLKLHSGYYCYILEMRRHVGSVQFWLINTPEIKNFFALHRPAETYLKGLLQQPTEPIENCEVTVILAHYNPHLTVYKAL